MAKVAYGLAALLILGGLVWMGQGSGYFPYPAESFMIDQTPGLVLIIVTGRNRSRS
jgi:hypothetical protein